MDEIRENLKYVYKHTPRDEIVEWDDYNGTCVLFLMIGGGGLAAFDRGAWLTVEVATDKRLTFDLVKMFIESCKYYKKPIRFKTSEPFISHCGALLGFEKQEDDTWNLQCT